METKEIVKQWLNGVKIAHICHKRTATYYKKKSVFLGVVATSLSIIVGAGIFTTLSLSTNDIIIIVTGVVSLFSALFSGLNTYLKMPERAYRHRNSSIEYGNLRREIEELFVSSDGNIENFPLSKIREKWNEIDLNAPEIPQKFHNEALDIVKRSSFKITSH